MKHQSRRIASLFSFCFLFLFMTATAPLTLSAYAAEASAPVSPALYVLAEQNGMAKAALRGNAIRFGHDDFARAVNLSEIDEVTITEIPPITDGELRLGNVVVNRGQTVSGSNLSLLSYVASDADIQTSSFRFSVNGSPVDISCKLYLLEQVNACPTLSVAPEASLNVSTHRNITLYGTLPCYDPDGDETIIEIVSYPKNGILTLTDRSTGEYTYTPRVNNVGKDSFTYVARDIYGNYSASATVSLSVVKPSTSVVYADLVDSPLCNAALDVTEADLMSGTQIGQQTYFYPEQEVSRADFVVMAMRAIGIDEPSPLTRTVFSDTAQLSEQTQKYLATAYELGYIQGEQGADGSRCFAPDRSITRSEAAVILSRMLNAATPTVTPVFSDSEQIPAWASSSVYSLSALGVMASDDGSISPLSAVTRGDAARMLSVVLQISD